MSRFTNKLMVENIKLSTKEVVLCAEDTGDPYSDRNEIESVKFIGGPFEPEFLAKHRAMLVTIEPYSEEDSAEKLLVDMLHTHSSVCECEYCKRAIALDVISPRKAK